MRSLYLASDFSSEMRKPLLLALALLVVSSSVTLAAPVVGVYRADGSRVLQVISSSATSFTFTLSVGVAKGETSCAEGDMSCLAVAGDAKLKGDRYQYIDSDDPSSIITFSERDDGIDVGDVAGPLGTGSGNMQQLTSVAGGYEYEASDEGSISSPTDYVYFQAPSGNIGCAIWLGKDSSLRCDMKELQQTYRDKPSDCEFSWGSAFEMTATGKGQVICFNDTAFNADASKLDYGKSRQVGSFSCASEKTGLTCVNSAGHGFALSKARQKVF